MAIHIDVIAVVVIVVSIAVCVVVDSALLAWRFVVSNRRGSDV